MNLRDLERLLRPIRNRVANMVARAVVDLVSDAPGVQVVQLGVLGGETREGIEHPQPYGFTSVPLAGAEAVVLFVGGTRDHGLAVVVDDRRYRKKSLQAGEVAVYHKDGASILLKADGSIEITPKAGAQIVLAGGTTQVALADHTHSISALRDAEARPLTGTLGASSSNSTKVKAG